MTIKPCWLYFGFSFVFAVFSWPCVLLHNTLYFVRYSWGMHPVWVLNIREFTFLIPTAAVVYFVLFVVSRFRPDLSRTAVVSFASLSALGLVILYTLTLMFGLWMISMGV